MNLQPVDFKAVAAKGCYVYCYLRADGSPYYVGIGTRPERPFQKHSCSLPRTHVERIRVLRHSLTREQACSWEQLYIARYGRKDNGTGILYNLTDGGEGAWNTVNSDETRQRKSEGTRKARRAKMTPEQIQKREERLATEARRSRGDLMRGHRTKDVIERCAEKRLARVAQKWGIEPNQYLYWDYKQREAAKAQIRREQLDSQERTAIAAGRRLARRQGMTEKQQHALAQRDQVAARFPELGYKERNKIERQELGMTKREHEAWIKAGRPAIAA